MTINVYAARVAACVLAPAMLFGASCAPKQATEPASTSHTEVVTTPSTASTDTAAARSAATTTQPPTQSATNPSTPQIPSVSPASPQFKPGPPPTGQASGGGQTPAENQAQAEIQKVYDAQDAAIKRKDFTALQATMASDYVAVDPKDEKADAASVLKDIGDMLHDATHIDAKSRVTGVVVDGKDVRATVRSTLAYEVPGTDAAPGAAKTDKYEISSMAVETWRKDNGVWKVHFVKLLGNSVLKNGNPQ